MSRPLDEEATMSFEEKVTWLSGAVTLIVAGWYVRFVVEALSQLPVEEIAYQRALLVALGAMIVLTIAGTIAVAIGTAIAKAIGVELTGQGSVDDVDRKDERDAVIEARGDRFAYYVVSALMIGALAMAMLELPHFWIANAMFAAFVVSGMVGIVVKLVAYRRGF
jgi:hypothetical protein